MVRATPLAQRVVSLKDTDFTAQGAPAQARSRSRHLSLLQIAGLLTVIAVHVGLPYTDLGWFVVELFFVIAGINMATALDRDQSMLSYVLSRIRRLGPQIAAVWSAAVLFVATGAGTPGMMWFILAGPVFVQNLTVGFFRWEFPNDWVFGPLWFVGALVQLQLLLFVGRKVLSRAKPAVLVFACIGIAVLCRLLFAALSGANLRSLPEVQAGVLYCLPFTYLEPIVLGVLIGRGALPRIGRLLPAFCLIAIGLGAVNVALSQGEVSLASLGFPLGLRLNYAYVWGYSIVALVAASLCSPSGWLAIAVEALKLPGWMDRMVFKLASLSYGAYAFHGLVMATGVNAAAFLEELDPPAWGPLLFVITTVQSFLIAWAVHLVPSMWRTFALTSGAPRGRIAQAVDLRAQPS